jgi:GTP1/Obg family GTP-binding protein
MPQGRPLGSTKNPNQAQSAMHPKLRMTWKRALKIEKIARLVADPAGYTNEQIGNHLNCTAQTVVYIKQLPEFHAKMIEVTSGVTSAYDQELRADTDNARAELASMVPSAMMQIRNALLSKNENIRVKAAFEILDRDGNLAKVSKSSVALVANPDLKLDPAIQGNIMALLAGAPQTQAGSPGEVEALSTAGFTLTAKESSIQQITLEEDSADQLADLELKTKPN